MQKVIYVFYSIYKIDINRAINVKLLKDFLQNQK